MGRPSKLANGEIRGLIDKVMLEHPDWGSRRISKELASKYDKKVCHATISKYKNDSNSDSVKLTKIVAEAIPEQPKESKKLEISYMDKSEFLRAENIFSDIEKLASQMLTLYNGDPSTQLRAMALRMQNATNYARITGKGLSAEEIENYENIITSIRQKAMDDTNRILKAVKENVPEKYFIKVAEAL